MVSAKAGIHLSAVRAPAGVDPSFRRDDGVFLWIAAERLPQFHALWPEAVLDPAPFDKWPREMRLMVGEDFRRITFTFYYN